MGEVVRLVALVGGGDGAVVVNGYSCCGGAGGIVVVLVLLRCGIVVCSLALLVSGAFGLWWKGSLVLKGL